MAACFCYLFVFVFCYYETSNAKQAYVNNHLLANSPVFSEGTLVNFNNQSGTLQTQENHTSANAPTLWSRDQHCALSMFRAIQRLGEHHGRSGSGKKKTL